MSKNLQDNIADVLFSSGVDPQNKEYADLLNAFVSFIENNYSNSESTDKYRCNITSHKKNMWLKKIFCSIAQKSIKKKSNLIQWYVFTIITGGFSIITRCFLLIEFGKPVFFYDFLPDMILYASVFLFDALKNILNNIKFRGNNRLLSVSALFMMINFIYVIYILTSCESMGISDLNIDIEFTGVVTVMAFLLGFFIDYLSVIFSD